MKGLVGNKKENNMLVIKKERYNSSIDEVYTY